MILNVTEFIHLFTSHLTRCFETIKINLICSTCSLRVKKNASIHQTVYHCQHTRHINPLRIILLHS